jgi:methyltransferase (TIGR00027 family)
MAEIELHYLGRVWQVNAAVGSSWLIPTGRRSADVSPRFRGSITALGTSLIRAAHSRLVPHPLIDDRWGDVLVPEEVRAAYRELAISKLRSSSRVRSVTNPDDVLDEYFCASLGYPGVITRTRYTEDALCEAVADGIRQYVIIGAGFDSFALRRPPFAEGVSVFEIDQSSTQALKRQRISECGAAVPESLHFVTANLAVDDLVSVLSQTAYDAARPAVFSWLGVTMFLTREANLATLQAIARCGAPKSELVFTYFDQEAFRTQPESFRKMQEANRASGEPFQSGFEPDRLGEDLRRMGLELLEDLTDVQLVQRLSGNRTYSMTPLEYSHIARARRIT